MNHRHFSILVAFLFSAAHGLAQNSGKLDVPKSSDPRLVVELIAQAPDIVHPVACDFDSRGRLLVVESHTHFAPKDYKGPKFDRIRAFDVKNGKATTFFEGTRHTMDLAVHPDGAVYIATRNEILRLRETKDGVKSERIVFLDTKGDYPHNGLSGLCFDSKGDLFFGMGENLGVPYVLKGSDNVEIRGDNGGEILHCTADGKKLRSIARGFWNPFGNCRDIYGRLFCVDNDPDQSPPCRMLHVVEGGDYGFRFCYGRSGKHPFQSWHGELPGTLPMMTGVGEAPCEILSYESDGLPKEYLGQLLVTSWADHRVERYKVVPHGASFKAERLPFVQGGNNFRPTGMCVAPDGSLYICDWVLSNYTLHGKGAIWHIREKQSRERKRPVDPREAILSLHRPLREAAAKKLTGIDLRKYLRHDEARVRAATLTALLDANEKMLDLKAIGDSDKEVGMRETALRAMVQRDQDVRRYLSDKHMTVRVHAVQTLDVPKDEKHLLDLLNESDPFVKHAAIQRITELGMWSLFAVDRDKLDNPRKRMGFMLAFQRIMPKTVIGDEKFLFGFGFEPFLHAPDEETRFLAVKWIADEKLADYRPFITKQMTKPEVSVRMYTACATALARIDGKNVNEKSLADTFAGRLADDKTPPRQRAMLLKQVPANHKALTVELLAKFLKVDDDALRMEAVRALVEHPSPKKGGPLLEAFRNPGLPLSLRAFATLGLGAEAEKELAAVARDEKSPLRNDALRALNAKPVIEKGRPLNKDLDAWLKRLDGPADADAGARVFFHPRVGMCSRCHRIDGRGADVGPDLSGIGRTDRRHILESILQPSNTVAPHYQTWHIESADGKARNGMLIHTQLDEYTFLDSNGGRFNIKTGAIAEQRAVPVSIMPEGLVDRMTDQDLRDLLAYLQGRK